MNVPYEGGIIMSEDPNLYHCHLPTDLGMYDHLPYHPNPELGDGRHIKLISGNIIRGCPVNYSYKKIIIPNEEDEEP